jgi:hypothetical protein
MNIGILGVDITGITLRRYLEHSREVLEAAGHPGGALHDHRQGRIRLRYRRPYPYLEK